MRLDLYFATAAGVLVSVILPLIRPLLPKPDAAARSMAPSFWKVVSPYLATGLFSLIVACLITAYSNSAGRPIENIYAAFIAGYLADSTLQKLSLQMA
ncbi:hypothetical protein [Hymenobacter nivis]|nr:hypothetical protein [Hymenobacter nivis]